jgi:hypothetical protein
MLKSVLPSDDATNCFVSLKLFLASSDIYAGKMEGRAYETGVGE